MLIANVRIENYKCYLDTTEVELGHAFNVIVGRNDVGKSAFVEALSLKQISKPHRSLATLPNADDRPPAQSRVSVTFSLTAADVLSILSKQPDMALPRVDESPALLVERMKSILANGDRLHTTWTDGVPITTWTATVGQSFSQNFFRFQNPGYPAKVRLEYAGDATGSVQDFSHRLAEAARDRLYVFRAERLNVGECAAGGSNVLRPDAANLPDVLNQLSAVNPVRYERLMTHVRSIFPHITQVTAPFVSGNLARILVWSVPLSSERSDLAVQLSESGTGIGQVLAMLYVVVTSERPTVLVIDEPQSFLHPGAVRKLMEILRKYDQHQYVITTHSPVALSLSDSDRVFLVKRDSEESTLTRIDPNKQLDLSDFLNEVGARLSDVFGADSILWVEGKTEEICFPELISNLAKVPLQGVLVLGVISTDELTSKRAERVLDVYAKLTSGPSLMPPALNFLFDSEGKSDLERSDISRKSRGLVKWLPARMYENYFLVPSAIAAFLRETDASTTPPNAELVSSLLSKRMAETKYCGSLVATDDLWAKVHGAKLLADVIRELTDDRVSYDKVKHGLWFTRYLIAHPTAQIRALADQLSRLVGSSRGLA
ncbi:MAG: AAA family ATPase [Burkholderiales bacterium]|nr:AAA family ATPase [Burkholderiales bacterium]